VGEFFHWALWAHRLDGRLHLDRSLSRSFVLFLSNRNHPNERGSVQGLRARLGTLAAEAIADYNFAYARRFDAAFVSTRPLAKRLGAAS
jgi:hypothetical protein